MISDGEAPFPLETPEKIEELDEEGITKPAAPGKAPRL